MKVVITGGAGFVGSHLCDSLISNGHKPIIFTRDIQKNQNVAHLLDKIDLVNVDVTNYSNLEKKIVEINPDIIFHLAGQTSHKLSFENPLYDIDANAKSTLNILEILRKSEIQSRFILGSTFVVIGKPKNLPINEESACNPTSIYGANRLASENYCKIFSQVYGLDIVIFRITNSFGPREQYLTPEKNAINFLIHNAFKGKKITIFNKGEFFRDVIYIDDVISALEILMTKGKKGNLYWISSNKKTWFYEIGKILEEKTNGIVIYGDATEYNKKVDVGNFLVDNSKLKALGWNPNVLVKDGIVKTLEYFSKKEMSTTNS
jgi:UDP-glucose 4-epimerase